MVVKKGPSFPLKYSELDVQNGKSSIQESTLDWSKMASTDGRMTDKMKIKCFRELFLCNLGSIILYKTI